MALLNLKDQMLKPASGTLIDEEMKFPKTVFSEGNAAANLKIISGDESLPGLAEWCFR